MRTFTIRRSPAPIALVAIVLTAFALLFAWPQSAAAHDSLVASDPAADSTIETLPEELTLTFSAALISGDGSTAVVVKDAAGNSINDGEPTVDGAMVIQPLIADAEAGEYTVLWQVVSSDGHPTDGEFSFTLSGSAQPTTSPDAVTSPEPETTGPAAPIEAEEPIEPTEPASDDAFLVALPWIIGGVLVVAAASALLAVRARRRRKVRNSESSGSDAPAER